MTDNASTAGYRDVLTGSRDPDAAPGAARVRPTAVPETAGLLRLAVGVVVVAALYFGQEVLVPITLAVLLSFVLSPLVNRLQRLGLWRAPSVMLTVVVALGLIGAIGTLIGTQAASLAGDAPRYAQTIQSKVTNAQSFATTRLSSLTKFIGNRSASRMQQPPGAPGGEGAIIADQARRPVPVEVTNEKSSPLTVVRNIVGPVLAPLETTALVLIVAIFVLMQKEDLRDRFIRLFGSNDLHRTTLAMDDAGQRLSRYFLSQLCVNAAFGAVIGIGTWAIGIPAPALWGILAGLLRFVPYIGSALAAIAPIALGAAIDPGWSLAIYVAILFVVVEPVTGYVVEPLLYGHSTGLSPVSVIVSAIFWTWLWGPIGLILSTPLTLCLVVMGRHVKSLEFFDVLLGDRPALTPVESFYQRVLADNPDEALAQAEALLTDRTLVSYYDDVVLAGLKLAAEDEARGTIGRDKAAAISGTMIEVVDELADHADVGTAASRVDLTGLTVACVAGRGAFDEPASAMLAQLCEQAGATVRRIRHEAVQRDRIGSLDLAGVDVVAMSYLQLADASAHLRYLIRRLRQRLPDGRIIVGLWPEKDAALADQGVQRAIGADGYVRSLAEMIETLRI